MECLFCAIVRKEVPAEIVYEDKDTLAFLDINPRSTGMTVVIPKRHYTEAWEDEEMSKKVFSTAIRLSKAIKKGLKPLFVSIAVMPSQVPHFHVRLYPMYEKEIPLIENQPKKVEVEKLKQIAETIRRNVEISKEKQKNQNREEKKEKKPKEIKRTKEEVYWIKRELNIA